MFVESVEYNKEYHKQVQTFYCKEMQANKAIIYRDLSTCMHDLVATAWSAAVSAVRWVFQAIGINLNSLISDKKHCSFE